MNRKIKISTRHCLILIVFLFNELNTNCQDSIRVSDKRNSVHVEGATAIYIGMYSINYERKISQLKNFKMNIDIGVGEWYLTTITKWYYGYSLPLSLNGLIGSKNNYFQIDLGMRYTIFKVKSDKDMNPFFPIIKLGYRFQKPEGKGLIFRSFIGLSGFGIGIGKAF